MTTRTLLLALSFATLGCFPANASNIEDIAGNWSRGDGKAHIRIEPCGTQMCAVNTWIQNPTHSSEAVGDKLVLTLAAQNGSLLKGDAFDQRRDLNYSMKIQVGQDRMVTEGCVLGGIICKKADWTRLP